MTSAASRAAREATKDGYTIDELTAATGVPERTIRFYRQIGLVCAPERVGRRAFYPPSQLARLRLIASLRERGLGLDAVARILEHPSSERRFLSSLLEIGDALRTPWTDDESARMTQDQVMRTLGKESTAILEVIERYGIVRRVDRDDPPTYDVPSIAALGLAGQLVVAGVDPELASKAWQRIQHRLGELADELVSVFAEHSGRGFPGGAGGTEIVGAFADLRPIALQAIQLAFAQQIARALAEFVQDGGVFEVTSRRIEHSRRGQS